MKDTINCHCPQCGFDVSPNVDIRCPDSKPQVGDFAMCGECATLSIFGEDMKLREPTLNELMKISPAENFMLEMAQTLIRSKHLKDSPFGREVK